MTEQVPVHVVIIPDGNRRWAALHGLKYFMGHKKSAEYIHIKSIIDEAKINGIKYLSIWGFSTENWNRDNKEVRIIMDIILKLIKEWRKNAKEEGIRFRHFGRKDRLPKEMINELDILEKETTNNLDINVQLCLDYGGRDELIRAINKMFTSNLKKIEEKEFTKYLDSSEIPDPDLIIRTSGEKRISGFMPFQSVYSEFYFTDINFPDFGPSEFRKAIEEFKCRERRFGGTSKK